VPRLDALQFFDCSYPGMFRLDASIILRAARITGILRMMFRSSIIFSIPR